MFQLTAKQRELIKLCAMPGKRHILGEGGGRSGKTFTFVRNTVIRACKAPRSRHGVFRLANNACHQAVYLDTYKKVLRDCFPDLRTKPNLADGYDTLPNGSEIWFGGLDDKERVEKILGKEFSTIYFNECSQIPYSTVVTVLTRLAQKISGLTNKAYYDLNPLTTSFWTDRLFKQGVDPITRQPRVDKDQFAWMRINPIDNIENIDPAYIASLEAMPERFRKRFLEGLPISDLDNALWSLELIERQRLAERPEHFDRIVVAVDPSGCAGEEDERSDEIGIAVVGRKDGKGYLLADETMRGSPEQWGRKAVALYEAYEADAVVGEVNFGGDMVRATIHAVNSNVRFIKVTASRGKAVRAEPVSALYEQGKMFHCGTFAKLEEELQDMTTDGYKGDRSPNRLDALVWGAHELLLTSQNTGLLEFYKMDHERRMARRNGAQS